MNSAEPDAVASTLFAAYANGDLAAMRVSMADGMVGWVTNAEGQVDRTDGADAYIARLPDVGEAELQVRTTQVLRVDDERAMVMVAVRASRHGLELENYAAFLARVVGGVVVELWMVEAQPAYSDEFWS